MGRKAEIGVKGDLKKTRNQIQVEREVELEKGWEISLMEINRKEGFMFSRIERKTPVLRPSLQSNLELLV